MLNSVDPMIFQCFYTFFLPSHHQWKATNRIADEYWRINPKIHPPVNSVMQLMGKIRHPIGHGIYHDISKPRHHNRHVSTQWVGRIGFHQRPAVGEFFWYPLSSEMIQFPVLGWQFSPQKNSLSDELRGPGLVGEPTCQGSQFWVPSGWHKDAQGRDVKVRIWQNILRLSSMFFGDPPVLQKGLQNILAGRGRYFTAWCN